ncbi:serine hydrolase domain-containing protein, partial [Acidobacteriota bacterium]
QRLEKLSEILEQKRQENHIPGMALAVVKDGNIIFTQGFGWADIEKREPMTPNHVFAIGSASKAFTTTLIGMMVDEGRMTWDDPLTRFLPYFTMKPKSPDPDAVLTIRDCLTHRSGFIRTNMIWLLSGLSREEVLKKVTEAVPWMEFRKSFVYTNIMYMAAGVAAGKAGDSSWDTLIKKRIFAPLEMTHSFTLFDERPIENLANGYIWDDVQKQNFRNPRRSMDNVGPAGSVNSTVLDMAKWIIFHLNNGKIGEESLLSEESHNEMWSKQFDIGRGRYYGFGWFLRDWRGRPAIEHGGGIDGFTTQVYMLPEENIGFVLLTNQTSSPFPAAAADLIWGILLEDADEPLPKAPVEKSAPSKNKISSETNNQSQALKIEEILALRKPGERKAALEKMGIIRITGTATIPQSGLKGTLTWTIDGADRHYQKQDYGSFGHLSVAVDGDSGQRMTYWLPLVELYGKYLDQGRQTNLLAVVGDWKDFFADIRFLREDNRDGQTIFRLQMTGGNSPPQTVLVDSETGDILSAGTQVLRLGSASRLPEAAIYKDYRDVNGIRFPFHITYSNNYLGQIILEITKIETNLEDKNISFLVPGEPINKK